MQTKIHHMAKVNIFFLFLVSAIVTGCSDDVSFDSGNAKTSLASETPLKPPPPPDVPTPSGFCPQKELISTRIADNGYGNQSHTCTGTMPLTAVGKIAFSIDTSDDIPTGKCWMSSIAGQEAKEVNAYSPGTACTFLPTGQEQVTHLGFSSTLTGPGIGTCKHYCTILAYCDANAAWSYITFTW